MARRLLAALLAASLLLPLARPDSSPSLPATATAYDELRLRGFPRGLLLPKVWGSTLDATSRDFIVDFHSGCQIVPPAGSYLCESI